MWREIKRPPVSAQQTAFLRRLKLRRYTICPPSKPIFFE